MSHFFKRFLYLYQRMFWYVAQAKNEALKPLGFWNETLLIMTFLAVSDVRPPLWTKLIVYLLVLAIAAAIGKFIVSLGIIRYNTKIANNENEELMRILRELEEIKQLIRNDKG